MKQILIVDDDRDVFESMKIVLEAEGYTVDWATNGAEALQKAKACKPDLVILDVMMNSDDEGFQVTYKMKQDTELSRIPIVMVTSVGARTGFSFNRARDEDFLPVNEFLEKPVEPRVLIDKVRENLGH
jgi:CheY-like chemotaxis protein